MTGAGALASLGVALGVGLLVGLEREQSQAELDERRFGGIRTFALLSLLGGVAGLLQPTTGWGAPLVLIGLVGVSLVVSATLDVVEDRPRGITTEVAALTVMLLGLLAALPVRGLTEAHRWAVVAAGGTAVMALLSMRRPLHRLARSISSEDLYATGKLGVLLLVVVPLLPRGTVAGGLLSPFEVGLYITLIAVIGFVGYLASRTAGSRGGLLMTWVLGGWVSSTAVALACARRFRERPEVARAAATGVLLATVVMLVRTIIEVALVSPRLAVSLAPIVATMAGTGLAIATIERRFLAPGEVGGARLGLHNPFALGQALRFGLLFLVTLGIVAGLHRLCGTIGLAGASAAAGLTDSDAIALAIASMHRHSALGTGQGARALFLALAANTAMKGGIATIAGGRPLGLRVLYLLGPVVLAGALAAM